MFHKSSPVGPVLHPGSVANAVVAAIKDQNPAAIIESHGAYLRVSAPGRCLVTRAAIEAHLGAEFRFPSDLEAYMPAFAGRLTMTHEAACWTGSAGAADAALLNGAAEVADTAHVDRPAP